MKRLFSKNTELKAIALVLAILLWFFVTLKGQSEIIMELPVEYKNTPRDFEIVNTSGNIVTLNVQGVERSLKNLSPKDISIQLDLSDAKEGENLFYLNRSNVKIPQTLTVKNIKPSFIIVQVDKTIVKTVDVKAVLEGAPMKGYVVEGVKVTPERVAIAGPRKALEKLTSLETAPIDINGIESSMEQYATLNYKEIDIRNRNEKRNEKVKVAITIAEETRTVAVKAVLTGKPKAGFSIKQVIISPDKVVLEGPYLLLHQTASVETAPLDVSNRDTTVEQFVPLNFKDKDLKSKTDKIKIIVIISGERKS